MSILNTIKSWFSKAPVKESNYNRLANALTFEQSLKLSKNMSNYYKELIESQYNDDAKPSRLLRRAFLWKNEDVKYWNDAYKQLIEKEK